VTTPLTVNVLGPDSELSATSVVELDDDVDGSIVVDVDVVVVVDPSAVEVDDSSSLSFDLEPQASEATTGRIKARRDMPTSLAATCLADSRTTDANA